MNVHVTWRRQFELTRDSQISALHVTMEPDWSVNDGR